MLKEGNELHMHMLNQEHQDIESKHFKDITDVAEEDRAALTDSDNGKNNNSSDEICSLNSSNENLDDEYYDDNDNGADIVDQIFSTKTTNGSHHQHQKDKCGDDTDSIINDVIETKYVASLIFRIRA